MSTSFAGLGVSQPVAGALAERGITEPFAVQKLAVADVLAGRDVLVQSPTGSGKTLAFGVPMVDRLASHDGSRPTPRPAGLVLAPTRELAEQIVDEMSSVAHARALRVAPVFGGVGIQAQARRAAKAHIVVATPGRLEDLLQRRDLTLEHVQILVLDEADRMLDMGFKPPVDRIVSQMPKAGKRQTLFFSATLEGAAGELARAYTRDAVRHVHEPPVDKSIEVEHRFLHLRHDDKLDALVSELNGSERGRTLVFVRTKRGADRLVKKLGRHSIRAEAMHGNKSQNQRRRALANFERGDCQTLVATDVAARGIDVDEITHVINFDAPEDRDTYVHRTGRTGRAGASGVAASFILPDQDHEMAKVAKDLGLHREFAEGRPESHGRGHPAAQGQRNGHAARQHSGGGSRKSGNSRGGGSRNGGASGKSFSKTYGNANGSGNRNRSRRRRAGSSR
ncbi:MAG: DEAD/DEAH box helicase [Actinobacteria bacterium]|nr:DEAD/DEAH box helicase [Actinomycetota bacterium]